VEDTGKVAVKGCVCTTETGTFEASKAASAHKVTTELDSMSGSKGCEQKLQNSEGHTLQIHLRASGLTESSSPIDQNQNRKLVDKRLVDEVARH